MSVHPARRDTGALLSTLWTAVLLAVLFRDMHEILRPGFLQEVMTGAMQGNELTEGFLLAAGVPLAVQVGMVVAARVLPPRASRVTNIAVGLAAAAAIVAVTATGTPDLDDLFFAAVQVGLLVGLVGVAWRWDATGTVHGVGGGDAEDPAVRARADAGV